MRIVSLLLLLAAAALLDGTVTERLAIGTTSSNTVTPDAFLIALIAWLLLTRGQWALAGACAIGLACDLSAASRLGIVMIVFSAAGMACGWADEHGPQSRFGRIGTRLAAALGVPLVLAITLKLTGDVSTAWWMLVWRALAVGGFGLTLALPVALAMHWCRELLDSEARGSKHSAMGPYLGNRRGTTF